MRGQRRRSCRRLGGQAANLDATLRQTDVLSMLEWTFYRTHLRRGSVREGFECWLVQDHWKSYFTVPKVRHQLYNPQSFMGVAGLAGT